MIDAKIKHLFTDPKIAKYLPLYAQLKMIIRPNVIYELLILFETIEDEEIKVG